MNVNLNHIKYCLFSVLLLICLSSNAQDIVHEKTFDEDFKERYDNDKFNYEGKKVTNKTPNGSGSYSTDYQNEDKIKIRENNNSGSSFTMDSVWWLFVIFLVLGIVFLVYTILNNGNDSWFKSSNKNKSIKDYQSLNIETANPNDFNSLITKAENNNDYRLAVRYYYLLVLKSLSLKKMIEVEDDKTNSEYLNEIQSLDIKTKFSKILYVYNYTWYGEFIITKMQYQLAKRNFQSLIKKIG
ncbi:hypothetical protein [Pontimicrobium sp. IMCC45349]|uniref:hypothetical protein n=1 Tax=Pontimicrobium sp. IMCC45349 TaxID=3391574 RepID=UPI0039A1D40C